MRNMSNFSGRRRSLEFCRCWGAGAKVRLVRANLGKVHTAFFGMSSPHGGDGRCGLGTLGDARIGREFLSLDFPPRRIKSFRIADCQKTSYKEGASFFCTLRGARRPKRSVMSS